MKKVSLLIMVIVGLLLVGCSSSDKKVDLNGKNVNKEVVANKEVANKSDINEKMEEKEDDTITKKKLVKDNDTSMKSNIKKENSGNKQNEENSKNRSNKQMMSTYRNARFGFSVNYPKQFMLKEVSTNGDGAKMTSGKATIVVYGYNNVLNDSTKLLYEEDLKNIKKESIKQNVIKDNYFLISWNDKDMVHYKKTVVGKGSINSLTFSYPKDKIEDYDFISKQIEKSFKTPSLDIAH